ncbi:MAG: baseplate J/gp47 family protein, partial [Anaerolinea sp.]|nr:baseplate J/gp47 family protein [Anaerolinea sp.]
MADRAVPEYIYLNADDDAASVRDRLGFLRGRHVLLIWPETGNPLRRKLDLVLIQREAMRRAVRLALVTHDLQVMHNAAELNISTFETIRDSQRKKWKRGRSRVFAARLKRPGMPYDPDELMPYASRLREDEVTAFQRLLRGIARALALIALALIIIASAVLVVPGATITVVPAQTIARVSATIMADPTHDIAVIDVENGIIPATLLRVEVEERASLPTTGLQELLSTPALGSVVFINRSERAVEVLAGSLVSTSAGTPVVFRTLNDVIVPAGVGRQVEVPIEAIPESAGEIGNVSAGLINTVIGPLAESLEVRNLAPTFGGRSNTVRIVTA